MEKLSYWNLIPDKIQNQIDYFFIILILSLSCVLGFTARLFSVIKYESVIHEFDPWFNYRSTLKLMSDGFYNFLNWFDEKAWYPLGRIVGGTVYPGLMVTSNFIYTLLKLISVPIDIRHISVLMGPIFSCFTIIITFLLTREIWNTQAGLIAGCLMSVVPGYMSRSASGSYDNENVAIFAMLLTFYLWLKSVKTGHVTWSVLCSIAYFYMVSAWGGYVYIINIISLHTIALVMFQRYSNRLYVAFSVFYLLGLLFSMQIPFVGFQSIKTSEHMSAAFAFALLQFLKLYRSTSYLFNKENKWKGFYLAIIVLSVCLSILIYLTKIGILAPWSGRFYSLWDLTYASIHIPIITSVSEHQSPPWYHTFNDLSVLMCFYPAGIWLCFRDLNDERIFIILNAITATYFSGIMSRLVLTLTPVVCIASAISMSNLMRSEFNNSSDNPTPNESIQKCNEQSDDFCKFRNIDSGGDRCPDKPRKSKTSKQSHNLHSSVKHDNETISNSTNCPINSSSIKYAFNNEFASFVICFILVFFVKHSLHEAEHSYSSPSIVMASYMENGDPVIIDDFREAYYWLRMNTAEDAKIMSWWDYGYQITGLANRTTIVDNNTWNNSHIALVGKAMSSDETMAYQIINELSVDYVLVIFGGLISYSGDDINKFLWMVRISEGEHPKDIYEYNYFTNSGEYKIDKTASETMLNSLMYRLSYYNFGDTINNHHGITGFDYARRAEIGLKKFKLKHFEEAFTSDNWIVRIYKTKTKLNRFNLNYAKKRNNRYLTKKSFRKLKGTLNYNQGIVKGIKKKYYSFLS